MFLDDPTSVCFPVTCSSAFSPSTNPVTVPGAVNGCPLYALVADSVVKVTLLGVILNTASAVNSTPLTVAFASIVYTPASLNFGIAPHSFTSLPSCFKRYWIFDACTNELALSVQLCKLSFANLTVNSSNECSFPS